MKKVARLILSVGGILAIALIIVMFFFRVDWLFDYISALVIIIFVAMIYDMKTDNSKE